MADAAPSLPIEDVLPQLVACLRAGNKAVVIAPPGAGKTTMVAPAMMREAWCAGRILLLSPRRLAARAAAERMSELLGEPVGNTVGYATRMDSNVGAATRIVVMTEGIFRNQILADPELAGVSAVLFDEVHERNLDSDFALALALDVQDAFRPDLRLVAMSATLDGTRFSRLMDNAPIIESEGRSYPLRHVYVGRSGAQLVEQAVADTIRQALQDEEGDLLAFLPGVREIDRTADSLKLPSDIVVHKLHGQIDQADQRAAIRRDPGGRRKVILATSIAETSLTIDGVRIVVDSGLSRRPRYDRAAGITRLVTERVSQAAATQRAGRAARQGPGVAYRLWEEAATSGLIRFDPPEILESDLTALVLDCAVWGAAPQTLRWLDIPTAAAVREANQRLQALDAIDGDGRVTPHGRAMSRLPLPPALAHMLLRGGEAGQSMLAAEVAALLSERGLGGNDVDLETRLALWRTDSSKKAQAARALAQRWAKLVARQTTGGDHITFDVARLVATACPDRVAKRRAAHGEDWISVGGRGFRLDPLSPLASPGWLAVADVQGAANGVRILSAAALEEKQVYDVFADRIETVSCVSYDVTTAKVSAERHLRLGAILLKSGSDDAPDQDAIAVALLDAVRKHGLAVLPWSEKAKGLRARARFAGEIGLSDEALIADLDEWLLPTIAGRRRLDAIEPSRLTEALQMRLGWDALQRVERSAPSHFTTPAGTQHAIDYSAEAGPTVEARVQAFFGLGRHPMVGDPPIPLLLSLTSPAGRPIQTTRDLPGFWAGSWRDVAKDMRGRYPKHPWPDDPAQAAATVRTKKADARRNSN